MWTRYITPASLGLALFCFILPWIEVRCDAPRGGHFSGQGTDIIRTTQSGLQMTYGGVSTSINHMPLTPEQRAQLERQKGNRNLAAPAMIVYALCLLRQDWCELNVPGPASSLSLRQRGEPDCCRDPNRAIGVWFSDRRERSSQAKWKWLVVYPLLLARLHLDVFCLADGSRPSIAPPSNPAELTDEEAAAANDPIALPQRGVDDILIAWMAKLRSPRVILGAKVFAASIPFILFALYAWPGFLRPLPQAGIAMSGFVEYMISDEHIAAVKLG